MNNLLENAKKLRDNVYLKATVSTSGELWAILKTEGENAEIVMMNDDEGVQVPIVDLPDLRDLISAAVDYIEGLE